MPLYSLYKKDLGASHDDCATISCDGGNHDVYLNKKAKEEIKFCPCCGKGLTLPSDQLTCYCESCKKEVPVSRSGENYLTCNRGHSFEIPGDW